MCDEDPLLPIALILMNFAATASRFSQYNKLGTKLYSFYKCIFHHTKSKTVQLGRDKQINKANAT